MQISVATANLYFKPFEQVLEIIAEAGFQNIELDLFWSRKQWTVAQHLKDVSSKHVIQMVQRAGLRISSIHDAGGVLEEECSIKGFLNPALDQYLSELGYPPDCLVFHTPHVEGNPGAGWWERISDEIVCSLEKYRKACSFVCIENMPLFDGYFVPLVTPEALNAFAARDGLSVTLDTTHYAQIGIDIVEAARKLGENIRTVHLSDFKEGRSHVFIGEGQLDLSGLFDVLDKESLNAVTLESSLSYINDPHYAMNYNELVSRMREARLRIEHWLDVVSQR
jgi:sugar phosphate isomerase/epimerase